MCWLTLSQPHRNVALRWGWRALAHPSTPKSHLALDFDCYGRVALAPRGARSDQTPRGARADQTPGIRFVLLL